jgi:hypothetical protein
MKGIHWLASYPKSGNTWMRIFLINLLNPTLQNSINHISYIRHAASRALFDEYAGINSSDLTTLEIEQLRPKVYEAMAIANKESFFLKIHDTFQTLSDHQLLVSKKASKSIIYLVRNPLDVVVSFSKFKKVSIDQIILEMESTENSLAKSDQQSLKMQLPQILSSWNEHVKSWTQQQEIPILVVRYEDLLSHPIQEFKKVVDFLGLSYSDEEIELASKKSDFSTLKSQELEHGFSDRFFATTEFFRKGVSGEGLKSLSSDQIRRITSQHQEMMQLFGYLT